MPTITRFEDIESWKTARELTRKVYALSEQGQFAKDFGLKNQIQRASVSIMSNIAEGFESRTQAHSLNILDAQRLRLVKFVASYILPLI